MFTKTIALKGAAMRRTITLITFLIFLLSAQTANLWAEGTILRLDDYDKIKEIVASEKKLQVSLLGTTAIPSVRALGKTTTKTAWSLKGPKVRININGHKRPQMGKLVGVEVSVEKGVLWVKKMISLLPKSTNKKMLKLCRALLKRNAYYGTKLTDLLSGKEPLSQWDLIDEWGNQFELNFLPEMEESEKGYAFEILSAGADGEFGSLDDFNWHPKPVAPRPSRWGPPCEEELE